MRFNTLSYALTPLVLCRLDSMFFSSFFSMFGKLGLKLTMKNRKWIFYMFEKLKQCEEKYNLTLNLLILFAFAIRLYKLNFQSLWSDEVFSLMVSDPANSFKDIIGICRFDVHPPLYQLLLHYWFKIMVFSPFALRLLSVIFGTLGVFSIYKLAEEINGKYTGFVAGLILSVTYFHIRYSQEGRSYALLFLLSTLSVLYFVKSLKQDASKKYIIFYSITSLLMIYTHYFGFVILLAQSIVGLFVILKSEKKKQLLFKFFFSALFVFLLFTPWLFVLLEKLKLKGVPIEKVNFDFIFNYFHWYFKWNVLVVYVFILIFIAVFYKFKKQIRENVFIIFVLLILSFLIPYLRSLFVPVLVPRYTIVSLPLIVVLCALGITAIKNKKISFILMILFVSFSSFAVLFKVSYFSSVKKEQWREGIKFIEKHNKDNSSVLGNWDLMFNAYAKALNLKTRFKPIFTPVFNSLLKKQMKNNSKISFWLMKGHFDDRIDWQVVDFLQKHCKKQEEIHLAYTHVEHYVGTIKNAKENSKNAKDNLMSQKEVTDNIQTFLFPRVFKKDYTSEVQFKLIINSNLEITSVKKVLLDKNKNLVKSWSEKFGNYFLQPFASYSYSPLLFSKEENGKYVLEGVIQPYTAFGYLNAGTYYLRLKVVFNNKQEKITDIPFFVVSSNLNKLDKYERYFLDKNIVTNIIFIDSELKKGIVTKQGVFYSYDYDLNNLLNLVEKQPVLDYLKRKNYKFAVFKNNNLFALSKLKSILKLVASIGDFSIYEINFNKQVSENLQEVFKIDKNFNTFIKVYFNKKQSGKPILHFNNTEVVVGTKISKSYLMVAFAKDKLWNKGCGYIEVENGYYSITLNAKGLSDKFKIYPAIIFYNQEGEKVKSIDAKPIVINKETNSYTLLFKKTYTPFFTRSVKEKKPIAKGFKLPHFYSNLFFVDKNVKTIAIGLYFYKDKGTFAINELVLKKLKVLDNAQ